jgi:hypothetical protein
VPNSSPRRCFPSPHQADCSSSGPHSSSPWQKISATTHSWLLLLAVGKLFPKTGVKETNNNKNYNRSVTTQRELFSGAASNASIKKTPKKTQQQQQQQQQQLTSTKFLNSKMWVLKLSLKLN